MTVNGDTATATVVLTTKSFSQFNDALNDATTDLLNGKIVFRQSMTPFTPAEEIDDVIEFDPDALADALGG